jgi:phosphate acetyltransferase
VQVIAIVVNKVKPEQAEDVHQLLTYQLTEGIILAVIPLNKALLSPSMKEIHEDLNGNLLFGKEHLSNQVDNVVIGAMNVPPFSKSYKRKCFNYYAGRSW